jgi:hypothetical protein
MYKRQGKARQVWAVLADLAERHPRMTVGEYTARCIINGGR